MRFTIEPSIPFNLHLGLKDITREPFGLMERLEEDRYMTIIVNRLVTVKQKPDNGFLSVESHGSDRRLQQRIKDELTRRFGLRQDLNAFYKFADRHRELKPLIRRLKGLRMFQKSSPFEALVTAITDQQLNVAFATTLKQRLITTYGRKFSHQGVELWSFPSPKILAALEEDALRELHYSGAKSRSIIRLSKGAIDGDFPLEKWSGMDDNELMEALMGILGVGRWTAEYVAMVGYARCDAIPAADIGLQRAVQLCYRMTERPTEAQVRSTAEKWRPWRGLVTYYLWHAYE